MTLTVDSCRLDDFRVVVERTTTLDDYPNAAAVEQNVLVYAADRLGDAAELVRALSEGPGVVVVKGAFAADVIDRASAEFDAMIAEQPAAGDHFARPGANDRVWNALPKLAVRTPDRFAEYYANDVIAQVATAWLGPGYQVTSQVNVVNPAVPRRSRTATTTSASRTPARSSSSRRTSTRCRRC